MKLFYWSCIQVQCTFIRNNRLSMSIQSYNGYRYSFWMSCVDHFGLLTVILWKSIVLIVKNYAIALGFTRSHYENTSIQIYWKVYHQKMAIFQIKKSDSFHISAQNIDCGYAWEPPRRGDSNEYPLSMFWAEIRKIMYTPVNQSFTL